ncbi:ubiquinol oxidase 2, mitochondrial-like [Iris pallida]|uniref:Ubiquinol oxidase n=1 Tax=Iris pallida TaxID=29817 RepID=A0AAX6FW30_IRIPA|nr:ubiquinol oxidase 2, mitochondrial-like [Iris pallida]
MHLMTLMEVFKPRWYERALVLVVQGVFFNVYFLGYLISPKFAQGGWIPRRGGCALVHSVPRRNRRRPGRGRPCPCHRHRLLAPAARRDAPGCSGGHPGRRGAPPRCQSLCFGHSVSRTAIEGSPCATRLSLIIPTQTSQFMGIKFVIYTCVTI